MACWPSIVGHDARDADTAVAAPAQRPNQAAGNGVALFLLENVDVGEPGGVANGDVDDVPAHGTTPPRRLPVMRLRELLTASLSAIGSKAS
jgi:hypothetical protein